MKNSRAEQSRAEQSAVKNSLKFILPGLLIVSSFFLFLPFVSSDAPKGNRQKEISCYEIE